MPTETQESEIVVVESESQAIQLYPFTVEQVRARLAPYAACTFDTPKAYKAGAEALRIHRDLRNDFEDRRKALNEAAQRHIKNVNSAGKMLLAVVAETEEPLKAAKKEADERKAREKAEREEAVRLAREAELRAAREAEEQRLAEQRAEIEAERQRLAAERQRLAAKIAAQEAETRKAREAEEAKIAAERAALDAERHAAAEAARKERERVEAAQRAEQARIDAERAALDEQKRLAELAEAERLAKLLAEREAAEQAERERIEAEEARVREAERQAALAKRLEALLPEREKALAYVDSLLGVSVPMLTDRELGEAVSGIIATLNGARAWISGVGQ